MRKLLACLCALPFAAFAVDQGYVTSAPPSYTPNTVQPLSLDANGNLRTTASGGSSGAAPVPLPSTNNSGTITTGGTFQVIAAANTSRQSIEFQNICNVSGNCTATTDFCYLHIDASGAPTKATSIAIGPGQYYLRSSGAIQSDTIRATCDGTGDKFYLVTQ